MAQRTCTKPGCSKPHRARGLCSTHYNAANGATYRRRCVICFTEWVTPRRDGKYCSDTCKAFGYLTRTSCPVPERHPSRRAVIEQRTIWTAGNCAWCGTGFITCYTAGSPTRYCTKRCARLAVGRRRRARQAGASGFFTWDAFMRLAIQLGNCCAYCGTRPDEPLEPDHVVPLNRGGHNGLGNILPACKACNGAKSDRLLHEWAEQRARLGQPPRRTDVSDFVHLTAHHHVHAA
jgi:5-methylcytosine-specific restriction endonuclease McrA